MKRFQRTMWITYLFAFLLAVVITFTAKVIFTPLLSKQQEQITTTLRLHETPLIIDESGLNQLIKQNQFDYIKVTNQQLMQPLVYENASAFTITGMLFNIPSIIVP
ncbi:MAG TPA: GGDEF domain-containing protein, partial [Psychromonas sp.]